MQAREQAAPLGRGENALGEPRGSSEHNSSTPGLRNSVTVNGSPGLIPMAAAMRGKRAGSILACATRMTSSYDIRTAR